MATITKPMALDETLHTTESTPRRQADVLAGIQQAIREGFGQVASGIEYDNTTSGLTSDNVQGAVDEVKAALDVVEDDITSTQEVTGNPLTLTDAAPINAEKLEVVLEPKQDLHGQSAPYVGGAGKNKFDSDTAYASYKQSDGSYRMTGTNVNGIYNYVPSNLVGKQLTFSAYIDCSKETSPNYIRIYAIVNGQSVIGGDIGSGNKGYAKVTFTPQSTDDSFKFTYGTNGGGYFTMSELQLEEGSERTSFAPYSNICPISGYDEVEVKSVGANTLEEDFENGYISNTGVEYPENQSLRSKRYNECIGGETLYCVSKNNKNVRICFFDGSKTFISRSDALKNTAFTVPQNACFYKVSLNDYTSVGTTAVYNNDISINRPSTDHNYHAYQSTTTSLTFGQTVYGGKSDFVEGGTKKKYIIKKISDLSWTYRTISGVEGYVFVSNDISGIKQGQSPVMASCYRIKTNRNYIDGDAQVAISNNTTATDCVIKDDAYTDATTFTTARGDETLLFELAEYEIITTPIAPLKLLDGINNISTNGTTINLGYQQNNVVGELKGEIEQAFYNHAMIHNIQSELTAVNMAYTDDYMGVSFDVPFIQEQPSETPQTYYNIDLSACDIAVNGIIPLYEDAQTGILVNSSKLIAIIEGVQKKDDCFRVHVWFYNLKMTSAADNITNAIIVLDITAFGKVLDLRTLRN